MTDNIYVYPTNLPIGVREMVSPGVDGYTIYVNCRYSKEEQLVSYLHAVQHIAECDWEKESVKDIENQRHE